MHDELDVDSIRSRQYGTHPYNYTDKDVIMYAISLGCTENDMRYIYENHPLFSPLPTFAVIPAFAITDMIPLAHYLPKFSPKKLLHGEHFVEIRSPIPTSGQLRTKPQVLDIQSKGTAAVVILAATTVDTVTNHVVAYNEFTSFIRDTGGFQVKRAAQIPRCAEAVAKNTPPDRLPDATLSEPTSSSQAVLYRLNGDRNPLHIDPDFAAEGGFPRPILHGLCTMGLAVKHVVLTFAGGNPSAVKSMKVRFSGVVFPGETLRTEMWREGPCRVVFRTVVEGRGTAAITNAAVVLHANKLGLPARL